MSPAAPEVIAATVGPEPDKYAASAPAAIAASIIGLTFSFSRPQEGGDRQGDEGRVREREREGKEEGERDRGQGGGDTCPGKSVNLLIVRSACQPVVRSFTQSVELVQTPSK